MMTTEIRNLHKGKEPELSCGKEKSLMEAREKLKNVEAEKEILVE